MGSFNLVSGKKSGNKKKAYVAPAENSSGPGEIEVENKVEIEEPILDPVQDGEYTFTNPEEQEKIEEELDNEFTEEGDSETNARQEEEKKSDEKNLGDELKEKLGGKVDNITFFRVFISGKLMLNMADGIIPPLMVKGIKMVNKKYSKTKDDLKLSDEEKEELEKLADAVVEDIFKNMSPFQQFCLAMAVSYAGKV